MPDESTSTVTIVDRTVTRPAFRREATRDLDVRKAVRSVDDLAVEQSPRSGWLDLDAVWAGGQRQSGWSDRSLVVFGGGMGIVALVVLVVSVLMVSENSTHPPAPARSSVAPSATGSPTATAQPPAAATAPPAAVAPTPSIAAPPAPATPAPSAQPAQTAPAEIAPPARHPRIGQRRLHELFPYLVPPE